MTQRKEEEKRKRNNTIRTDLEGIEGGKERIRRLEGDNRREINGGRDRY